MAQPSQKHALVTGQVHCASTSVMTTRWPALLFAALGLAAQPAAPPPAVTLAREDARKLMDEIRAMLRKELASGAAAGAVRVCSESAQKATRDFAARTGRSIRRVSLHYRNPANRPDAHEAARLRQLERLNRQSRLPEEDWMTVFENGREYVRYMKPITIQPQCLACHGERRSLSPEVRTLLEQRYPRDLATGYRAGDLRGAVTVTVPVVR